MVLYNELESFSTRQSHEGLTISTIYYPLTATLLPASLHILTVSLFIFLEQANYKRSPGECQM